MPYSLITMSRRHGLRSFVKDGKVTPDGISELKKRLSWADLSKFEQNPRVQDFGNLLTVSDLCRYVESKLG